MKRCQPRAFTLIELLVVLSIVSLLIAILLPALASARKSARGTACLANIRGLGQLMILYSADNKEFIPRIRQKWTIDSNPNAPSSNNPNNDYIYSQAEGTLTRAGYLSRTVMDTSRRLMACPSSAEKFGSQFSFGIRLNYALNANLIYDREQMGSGAAEYYTRIADNRIARSPGRIGWAIDAGRPSATTGGTPTGQWGGATRNRIKIIDITAAGTEGHGAWVHLGRTANVLYFDGHAGNVPYDVSIWDSVSQTVQQTNQNGDPNVRLYW